AQLQAIKDQLDALKGTAQGLVDALPASAAKDDLDARLDALDTVVPAVNDTDSNGIADDVDAAIAAATQAVQTAEAKHDELVEAIAAENGVISPTTQAELQAIKEELNALKGTAQGLVDALPASAAKDDLDARLDALDTAVPAVNDLDNNGIVDDLQEIVLPADNSVNFIPEVINPTTKLPSAEQQLEDKTAFAVASVGLGAVLEANVLTEVLQNSLTVDVADGTVRNLTLKSQSGGVSIVSMYDLKIYQFDEETGQYKEYMTEKQWLKAYLLAGVSEELNVSLPEGKYIVFLTPSVGITVLSGYTLKVLNDIILDYNEVVSVDGEATGNVITDADAVDGQDVLPTGTIVESVMAGSNAAITLNSNSETAIEGKFGTLFINQDGSYRYEINEDFKGPFGQVDEFTYYVKTELGNTASAKLNISIDNKVVEVKQSEINDTVIINPLPEIKDITGEVPKLTNVKVLDVSLLDPVIKAGAVDLSSFMNFTVNENNVREMTFQGDGGGVSLTSYSLFIYKFNADTNEYVQVHSINNWYTVILGGKSDEVTLKFTEGDYYAVTVPTGLNVLGGSGLYVNKDTLYDYSTVKTDNDFVGQTSGQIELANGSEIIIAGNTQLVEETELQGVYGKLILNKDGTYQYFVNKPSEGTSLPYGEIETFTYVIKDQNGNSSLETLTIKIDLAVAQDDFEESEIVMQNKSETIVNDTILDIGLAQRIIDAKFAIAENSVSTVAISFESTLSLTSSRSISYTVKNAAGTVVKTGELNAVTGKVLQLNDLPAGVYTVQASLVNPGLAYFKDSTITFNTTYLNEFTPVALEPVIGNVSNNDDGLNSISSYTINGLTTSTYSGNPSVTVEGKFGTLVFNNDGSYTYTPSGKGFGKEEFSYTVSTVGGTTSTATLSFDVNKSFTSSKFNDAFTGSDIADKLIFNLLDEADATGGNGFDTWSDFEAGVDVIDVSQLFVDANTSTTFSTDSTDQVADILSKYITVKDSVISIDRDGEGTQFEATQLLNIGPQNADLTLEQLLQNGQIIY
ncbi:BapA/Bap/LapF family large adhesin, partial [Acinetobacter sp. DSM 11652]|uniref:BapA/Bap/LapF family large adhesin n=1 Tax=Acinetobacter sp. DSM 11652 TaxID=346222 RepID=UPI0008B19A9B